MVKNKLFWLSLEYDAISVEIFDSVCIDQSKVPETDNSMAFLISVHSGKL